jgi:hypothetical protein
LGDIEEKVKDTREGQERKIRRRERKMEWDIGVKNKF